MYTRSLLVLLVCGLTLASSPVHSQINPTQDERSLYTSTAIVTVGMVLTATLFYLLGEEDAWIAMEISTCTFQVSELTTSTHELRLEQASHYIDNHRAALATDLTLAAGPSLDELLVLLSPSHTAHEHWLDEHLHSSRRVMLIEALYDREPLDWITLLLTHPD